MACKLPKEGSDHQTYPAMIPSNHNNGQYGMKTQKVQWWHAFLGRTNSSPIELKILNKREIMVGAGSLAKYLVPAKSWILENVQPGLY